MQITPEEIWKYSMVYAGRKRSTSRKSSRGSAKKSSSKSRRGSAIAGAKVNTKNRAKYILNPAGENLRSNDSLKPILIPPNDAWITKDGPTFGQMRKEFGDVQALKKFSKLLETKYTPSKSRPKGKSSAKKTSSVRRRTKKDDDIEAWREHIEPAEELIGHLEQVRELAEEDPEAHKDEVKAIISEVLKMMSPEDREKALAAFDYDSDSDEEFEERTGMGKASFKKILKGVTRGKGRQMSGHSRNGSARAGKSRATKKGKSSTKKPKSSRGSAKKRGSQMKKRGSGMIGGSRQGDTYRT